MGTKTEKDLQQAFAGESQANRRYLFFAAKADKEGYPQVARLFRAAAEAETAHAGNHFNVLKGVGQTADNLGAAVNGEQYEFVSMYPDMINDAVAEKDAAAEKSFRWAFAVEKIHFNLFEKFLKAVKEKKEIKNEPIYVCPLCGNTVEGSAPDICPICGTPGSKFKKIE
ncbi:MAG TPA: rubrerythrin family protein [Dehalococcoidales bacterium]|nr:rubrerythrin family protein [Dehalococcoidales bacterium]